MKTIIIIVALLASMSLAAQENISSILFSIEENNTKLKALKGIRQVYICLTLMSHLVIFGGLPPI